jgi:hypothetical protein
MESDHFWVIAFIGASAFKKRIGGFQMNASSFWNFYTAFKKLNCFFAGIPVQTLDHCCCKSIPQNIRQEAFIY